MTRQTLLPALLSLAALGLTMPLDAQQGTMSARQGIDAVGAQFGSGAVQWIAEVRGSYGIPEPNNWEILAYNDRSPGLLHKFWAGGGRVGDGGADESRYPVNIPVGYFNAGQIAVDSVAAFTIAEGEARKARMAFDSCDYLLRVREYSTEPIWRLELLDPRRRLVGKIYLSARNGEVLRTMWMYYNNTGRPQIVDSFAPTRPPETSSMTQVPPISQNPIQEPGVSGSTGIMAPPVAPPAPLPPSSELRYNDSGIPEPPAIESTPEEPKPPVEVPETEGSSDRIPPPPIPNS